MEVLGRRRPLERIPSAPSITPASLLAAGAVADFGRSQRTAIPGGRGSCRAVRFRSAVARQEPRPPKLTIHCDDARRGKVEAAE
jgi:hypothetical protein